MRDWEDPRPNSRLIDRVLAVKLVLASRGIAPDPGRLLDMVAWILEADDDLEPNGGMPVEVFTAAIEATKP